MAKNLTTADVLRKARGYVEKGWCQGASARNEQGRRVRLDNPAACCWCVSGAISMSIPQTDFERIVRTFKRANRIQDPLPTWNDAAGRTQADCVAAFDKAIKLAEKEATR